MPKQKIYHLNDRTLKYKSLKQGKRLHSYLNLPGEYESLFPHEIVFPNMDSGRVDDFHSTKEGLLINLEEESEDITEDTLGKFGRYAIFGEFMYSRKYYLAVLCHKNPKDYPKFFEISPSIYLRLHYYYFTQEELWEKYENVINKVKQKEELSETEALDIAFVPKFISKKYAEYMTESLSKAFEVAIIKNKELRRDVGVLLGAMIIKHVDSISKQNRLMEEIGMEQIENEIKILARDEYGEELRKIERQNIQLQQENTKVKQENQDYKKENQEYKQENQQYKKENQEYKQENQQYKKENQEYKHGIEKLNEIPNLNPEAKKIINSLIEMG